MDAISKEKPHDIEKPHNTGLGPSLYIGTMSGTSLDGIDLALLSFDTTEAATGGGLNYQNQNQNQNHNQPPPSIQLLGHKTVPFSPSLWDKMRRSRENCLHYAEIGELGQAFTTETAFAINHWLEELRHCRKRLNCNDLPYSIDASHFDASHIRASQIAAIGFHGHTLWHQPPNSSDLPSSSSSSNPNSTQHAFSWQMGCPSTLARLTNIPVVHDFRSADIAHGGQGAPLAPAFHQALFGGGQFLAADPLNRQTQQIMVLNLGGIANVTLLDEDEQRVRAGDTGPANCLIDAWYRHHHNHNDQKGADSLHNDQNAPLRYDHNGDWGRTGVLQPELLDALLDHPYFAQSFPKSTGFEQFNLAWLTDILTKCQPEHQKGHFLPEDVQCTLYHFTAETIVRCIVQQGHQGTLIVCGGGVHNGLLLELIRQRLGAHFQVIRSDDLGFASDAIEASAFAWLAWRFTKGLPGNLVSVTGASQPLCLGSWTPAPGRGFLMHSR